MEVILRSTEWHYHHIATLSVTHINKKPATKGAAGLSKKRN